MKRKQQNKGEIDDFNKHLFEYWIQLWKVGTMTDEFEKQLTQNEIMMRHIFGDSKSIMFPSLKNRNHYFYELPHFIIPNEISHINGSGNRIKSNKPNHNLEAIEQSEEIIETDKTVSITIEIHGVTKEDIELKITQNNVIIKANNGNKNFYKKVELPCDVDTDSAISSFQNSIFDVELKKK